MQENEKKEELTLEEYLERVSNIVNQLQSRDISLEDSFKLYEQGMQDIAACNKQIDRIEKKMLVINGEGELQEF